MTNGGGSGSSSYHPFSKILHWLVALLVFGLLGVGLYMSDLELSPEKLKLYGLHKAFGAVLLGLMVLRLLWRFITPPPPLPETMPRWQAHAARATHDLLYLLLFAMPISGWLMSSAAGFPVSVFGWFTLPDLVSPNPELKEAFEELHEILANGLMVLIGLHIAAALKHHFIDKDRVLRRMLPALMLTLLAMPLAAEEGSAPAPLWYIDPAQSSLQFTATQNDSPITGEFRRYDSNIRFDPERLEQSSIMLHIPMASLALSYPAARDALLSPDWLDATQFPVAIFRSTRITHSAKNNYVAEGFLRIRDKTQPVFLHFSLVEYAPTQAKIKGEASLSRSAFGVGAGQWQSTDVVKDEVAVQFTLVASTTPPRAQ